VQSLSDAHKLGCHHLAVARNGKVFASAGFGGEIRVWKLADTGSGDWEALVDIDTGKGRPKGKVAGEAWSIALSEDGSYLAATTYDGRINVWEVNSAGGTKIQEYETGSAGTGSFGLSVDLSGDGKYTASGHQSGAIYVFNNDTGKLQYSLPGEKCLVHVARMSCERTTDFNLQDL
jgi:superkiller protein 8